MNRLPGVVVMAVGIGAMVMNRRFGRASTDTSRNVFGVDLPEGSRRRRSTVAYSRVVTVAVGATMAVLGVLIAAGLLGK